MRLKDADGLANSVDPDQTSGSTLFAQAYLSESLGSWCGNLGFVNLQFFLDNSKPDEEDIVEEKPEIDLDECSNKINDSLKTAEDLTKKLGDLNQDIIEWLVNWANTKASNKWVIFYYV